MSYLYHGKLIAKAGHTEELANILLAASKLVSTAKGCRMYVIGKDPKDLNAVYATEMWDSKEDHDNSLKMEGVKDLISKAMLILETEPTKGQELEILGEVGV